MGAEKVIANLLRVAKEDLDGARVLSKQGNRNAIYLCEQAAEKVILAVVTSGTFLIALCAALIAGSFAESVTFPFWA